MKNKLIRNAYYAIFCKCIVKVKIWMKMREPHLND